MNKKGVTILELLVSISLISIIILLLIKVIFSLSSINNDISYASSDEIKRTEIIKRIENDFLKLKLETINIETKENTKISFNYENKTKELILEENKITYDNEVYNLESENAKYSLCPLYEYEDIDDNYYLIKLTIPVLIDDKNTTEKDDIILTYLNLKNPNYDYTLNYNCQLK